MAVSLDKPARPARKTDYPTGNENGMSFICNRWVFTGPQGYRVCPGEAGTFYVVSYTAAGTRPVYCGSGLTEDGAHEMAARLSRRPVNP